MGLKPLPKHTDASNYIDFQCESMLVNFGTSQDRWLTSLFGTHAEVGQSTKKYAVDGLPGERLHARFIVTLPPQEASDKLHGAVEIPFAGSVHIIYHENAASQSCP